MGPTLGPKRSDWFKASFMGNRFGAWLQITLIKETFEVRYNESLMYFN